jgi:hypothetical protein
LSAESTLNAPKLPIFTTSLYITPGEVLLDLSQSLLQTAKSIASFVTGGELDRQYVTLHIATRYRAEVRTMGSTQSAEAPRRPPTKLTKPRTNTSTSNLLAISSAPSRRSSTLSLPVTRNKRSSTVSLADVYADGEDVALKSKTSSRAQRRSLFRSNSAQPETSAPVDEPLSDFEAKMASNPLRRYSSMVSVRVDMMGDVHAGVSDR